MPTAEPPISTRVERLFVLSSYVTLFLACCTLVWAERNLVPGSVVLGAIVGPLLVAAYVLEGRWSLSTTAANVLGLLIAGIAVVWTVRESVAPAADSPLAQMPWPTSMVPLLGPLLLVLIPAKLFRPKSIADYWGLQGIGLACIGLGCALTEDVVFGLLLLLYMCSTLWCLALFFLYRERLVRPAAEQPRVPRVRHVLSWAAPIFVIGVVGFFGLPRSSAVWQVPQQDRKLETGTPEDQSLDLNRTAVLALDAEVAFEVYATDEFDRPKLDLPQDQRWRGPVYHYYYGGGWHRTPGGAAAMSPVGIGVGVGGFGNRAIVGLPAFDRPDKFYLAYMLKTKIGPIPFIADPIYRPNQEVPVITVYGQGRVRNWTADSDGVLRPPETLVPNKTRYVQVTVPPPARNLSHEIPVDRTINRGLLTEVPNLPGLGQWTEDLLRRLAGSERLPREAVLERDLDGQIHPRHYEEVARALEQHLSSSGEYSYTLNLQRADPQIDPTLDFLYNTRSGHCNRFASALALMLRSLHIPCQVVLGYRGADPRGDGYYDVRHCFAHTWVEVLVNRREAGPAHGMRAGRDTWHWLTLDPTPAESAEQANAIGNRFFGLNLDMRKMYRNLIVNFSADNRDDFLRELWLASRTAFAAFSETITAHTPEGYRLRLGTTLFALVALTGLLLVVRWLRRRLRSWGFWRSPAFPGTAFYQRMLALLARHGIKPAPAQTAREFAEMAAERFAQRSNGLELGTAMRRLAALFDRVRFGGRPLSAQETDAAFGQVRQLAAALAAGGN